MKGVRFRHIRWLLAGVGLLVAVSAGAYAGRWALLESKVRRELRTLATDLFQADDVQARVLQGTLVSSLEARDVVIRPGRESFFREFTVRELRVRYGPFGTSALEVFISGARLALAPSEGPSPPVHEIVRSFLSGARDARFPGRLEARDSVVTLADGARIDLIHAVWAAESGAAHVRTEAFGDVHVSVTFDRNERLDVFATASGGPVRSASVYLGGGPTSARPLRIDAETSHGRISWSGEAIVDARGFLDRVTGRLRWKGITARTDAELISGDVSCDVEGEFQIREEDVSAAVSVRARARGPLGGPPEDWMIQEAALRSTDGVFRGMPFDEVAVSAESGPASRFPVRLRVKRNGDRVEAEGQAGWRKDLEFDLDVEAAIKDGHPYVALWDTDLDVRGTDVRLEGWLRRRGGRFEGGASILGGAGEAFGLAWDALRVEGAFSSDHAEIVRLDLSGRQWPDPVIVWAKGDFRDGRLRNAEARLEVGGDRLHGAALLSAADEFEARFRFDGGLTWLGLPTSERPMRIEGTASGSRERFRVRADTTFGRLDAAVQRHAEAWNVEVEPSTLSVSEHERLDLGRVRLEWRPGSFRLDEVELSSKRREAALKLRGGATWTEREVQARLEGLEARVRSREIDGFTLDVSMIRSSGLFTVNFQWGRDEGDFARFSGTWGDSVDLRFQARVRNVDSPVVCEFVPEWPARGSLNVDARVSGAPGGPDVTGALDLGDVEISGTPIGSLHIPISSESGALVIPERTHQTLKGPLTFAARIPWSRADSAPAGAHVEGPMSSAWISLLPEDVRPWVPPGHARVVASAKADFSDWKVALSYAGDRHEFPAPLGSLAEFRLEAELDATRLRIASLTAKLGQGPLKAEGWIGVWGEGLPLMISIKGRDLLVVQGDLVRVRIDPDVVLTHVEGGPFKVAGKVEIPLVLYYAEFAPAAATGRKTSERLLPPGLRLMGAETGGFVITGLEGMERVELDLEAVSTGEVRIQNSVVGALLKARLRCRGTGAEPIVSGTIEARRGEVRLTTGLFIRIVSGQVDLPSEPSKEPSVLFEGQVGRGAESITILMTGSLERPNLTLHSDPPKSQEELLAHLAFGMGPGGVQGRGVLGAVTRRLIKEYTSPWPDPEAEEGLFDRVQVGVVEPASGGRPAAPWELPARGSSRGTLVRTEYLMNSYLSIVVETDRETNLGGDLKLRLRFR
ncbi:MAG: translocation/assembly module TamB domain-containing protein [Planctomycetes bacterium]|nr:translocation/assembly module TamB domain-containing protein [Planctomycetota bacterium]